MTPSNYDQAADKHRQWMTLALEQARLAAAAGEVPVGAVLTQGGELLSSGYNQPITASDPSAHAEIVTLRKAAKIANNYRLPGTVLYVTIEPCTMCVGALIHARIGTIVFGAREPRAGAVVSRQRLAEQNYFNHNLEYTEGVMAGECAALLQQFFAGKRGGSQ